LHTTGSGLGTYNEIGIGGPKLQWQSWSDAREISKNNHKKEEREGKIMGKKLTNHLKSHSVVNEHPDRS